jgi:hypothetical protein
VAVDYAFASSPQAGLAWLCFLFPLIEPDRQISRIRLSEKTHTSTNEVCNAACNLNTNLGLLDSSVKAAANSPLPPLGLNPRLRLVRIH